MHYIVMLILDDINHCPEVFDAWEKAGVTGITVFESTGLGRVRKRSGMRDDLPLMPNILSLLQSREERHRTLLTVVEEEGMVDALIAATEEVVGDLTEPERGVLVAWPLIRAVGLPQKSRDR